MSNKAIRQPLRNTYKVDANVWAGEYPGTRGGRPEMNVTVMEPQLKQLLEWGVNLFIDLTFEKESYSNFDGDRSHKSTRTLLMPYEQLLPEGVQHVRFPVRDAWTPSHEVMHSILRTMQSAIAEQRRIYVHCKGGIGRTGTVIGCYLVEVKGYTGQGALNLLANLRRNCFTAFSPETGHQVDMVRHWGRKNLSSIPDTGHWNEYLESPL